MNVHMNPGGYEHQALRHADLMAEGELERQLRAARASRPSSAVRVRTAVGRWLISLGERLARSGAATVRA
jgi:hypothetical protein